MEAAHQLMRPNGPYTKSQLARALEMARGSFYLKRKQAVKDKQVAVAIEEWHEQDDTLGHHKAATWILRFCMAWKPRVYANHSQPGTA